ncbi:unnamed protein product [Rotaria magnacalcarata]|uniref:Uncharacterized protein n=2 Tax=Rotaria magnacalcarata TaxID=392030 RepID=A0A820GEE3_9BILA|nr:unnamed protein product [Rotaria magnacalcarata]
MLINNQPPTGEPRHNYIHLGFLVDTLLLFIVHIFVNEFFGNGNYHPPANGTILAEALPANDITPSDWAYLSLNGLNYIWQVEFYF